MKKKKIALASSLLIMAASVFIMPGCDETVNALRNDEFVYEIENNEVVITGLVNTSQSSVQIPEQIDELPVTTIRELFGIYEEVTIPDTVTTIESNAFKSSYYLTDIVIPESVTEIGKNAFSNCPNLESCEIKGNITSISDGTFSGCESLRSVTYPDTVEYIGYSAFSGCSALEAVTIPEKVTAINPYTFYNCSSLAEIVLPENITSVGTCAFSGCSSVTSMIVPEAVETIGDSAFYECTSLQTLKLPYYAANDEDGTGDSMFTNCSSLESLVLPYGIEEIGTACFKGCEKLENIILPETVKTIEDQAFMNCSSLRFIDLPAGAVIYGSDLFNGCSSLKEVIIPDVTEEFGGSRCFKDCVSLEKVVIPSSIAYSANSLDINSFDGCNSLKELYFMSMGTNFYGNYLGYIHDETTDTYVKNSDFTLYCRKDSNAEKYAAENGLNYKIVDGSQAYVSYLSVYSNSEKANVEYSSYPEDTMHKNSPAFVYKDGVYEVSLEFGYFNSLGSETVAAVCTGVSSAVYPEFNAAPMFAEMNGYNMTDYYEDIVYTVEDIDGIYYLLIQFNTENDLVSQELTANTIYIGFEVSGMTGEAHDPSYLIGDLDTNGVITASDFVIMQQYLLKMRPLSNIQYILGDINEDGVINVMDLIMLKRYLINIPLAFNS
ncbi:MAG: leucine-rich repeat protein [Porcipelethomonas sp.]